jgi:hypothetical protein
MASETAIATTMRRSFCPLPPSKAPLPAAANLAIRHPAA